MNSDISDLSIKKMDRRYSRNNTVEWVQSGNGFYKRLEALIDSAEYEIHLQTYIFLSDRTGSRIVEALLKAAGRKIEIFLLVDAFGSQDLTSMTIQKLKDAGVNFRRYGELYSKGRFHIGRRMHQKIIVIDGKISIVGGINISDNYNDTDQGRAWLDFAVIIHGDISKRLQYICRKRWGGLKFSIRNQKKLLKDKGEEKMVAGNTLIRVRRNDFFRNHNEIAISYREALRHSKSSILLVGGYFLPGGRTRRLMKKAIERGVKIDVLVSERSDVKILINARRYLYDWLFRNEIGVYEYRPSNVHGKVIISDERWTSVGSYDLNNLSTYSNIELNVDINDKHFSAELSSHIRSILEKDCNKVTKENLQGKKSIVSRLVMWASYRFVKTLFVLSVLLAGKKDREI